MALKALMLRKKIDVRKRELEALTAKAEELKTREAELEQAINEAETDEERTTVEEAVDEFETEKKDHEEKTQQLEEEIEALESDLAETEKEQERTAPTPEEAAEAAAEPAIDNTNEERKTKGGKIMNKRSVFFNMDSQERAALIANDGVQSWLGEVRSAIKEKRAITGVGLTIPEVVLPVLQENIERWSKLYEHVNVQQVAGTGRQPVMGTIPEAIWTECCANLNELTLVFNDWEVDCFKVGGYYAVCKANVEDSDIDLMNALLEALGQGIGKALDKAILYGRNTTANSKMPLGVVTRLAQTAQPSDYPATARTWADLHESNIVNVTGTGDAIIKGLISASAVAANDYSRGELTWVANEKTYKKIVAESMQKNNNGALVAAIDGTMPIVGGAVEVLNFIPDDVIVFGYFDLYLLAERAGREFATSEHVRFIQDQVVYKGTARYDGAPIIAEAFGIVTLGSATVSAAAVTFPQDTAN